MKVRIKFSKEGVMKFIGHLDMMRYFQKAMRRAEIPIAYSKGFSPHQIMSFAAPLGVGITSQGEYLDIEIQNKISSKEACDRLNKAMVDGVKVLSFLQLDEASKPAMSLVSAADYFLYPKDENDHVLDKMESFYQQQEIVVVKKTKKSEATIDLKQLIYQLEDRTVNGKKGIFLKLSSGSIQNVKPELILEAYGDYIGEKVDDFRIQEHRLEVYTGEIGNLTTLESMGEEIE